jgi:putative spermidine/putrescine transport system ATP-binding protein
MKEHGGRIEFRDVRKVYGGDAAVEKFNAVIEPGSFITLLGASGSGKTTLLNMLAGFIEPSSGDILLDNQSIVSVTPEARNIGMVFQNYSLFPHMNVAQNVAFPLRMRKAPKSEIEQRVLKALGAVQLQSFAARMPRELSGGQQQRVAVARAISFGPRVLLMDEPLGALDLKLRETLQYEIKKIQRETGSTVVYVTHDQSEAMSMSDEIIILSSGKMIQRGRPRDIYDHPANSFVATFVGQCNVSAVSVGSKGAFVEDWNINLPEPLTSRHGNLVAAIRPEKISLVDSNYISTDGELVIAATVDSVQMFGNNLMVYLRMANGSIMMAQQFRTAVNVPDELLILEKNIAMKFSIDDVAILEN